MGDEVQAWGQTEEGVYRRSHVFSSRSPCTSSFCHLAAPLTACPPMPPSRPLLTCVVQVVLPRLHAQPHFTRVQVVDATRVAVLATVPHEERLYEQRCWNVGEKGEGEVSGRQRREVGERRKQKGWKRGREVQGQKCGAGAHEQASPRQPNAGQQTAASVCNASPSTNATRMLSLRPPGPSSACPCAHPFPHSSTTPLVILHLTPTHLFPTLVLSPCTCLSKLYMGPSPSDAGHLEALASAAALREDQEGLPGGAGAAGEEAGAEEEEEAEDALAWQLSLAGAAAAAAPALPAPAAPALPCLLLATAMRCSNRPPLLLLSSATALALVSCSFTATTLAACNREAQGQGGVLVLSMKGLLLLHRLQATQAQGDG